MYKLISKVVCAALLFGTSVFADSMYATFEGAIVNSQFKPDNFKSDSKTVMNLGVKVGNIYGHQQAHRAYIGYAFQPRVSKSTIEAGVERYSRWRAHKVALGYDFAPIVVDNIRAVMGAFVGAAVVDAKAQESGGGRVSQKSIDNSIALLYGFNLGGMFELDNLNAINFGFRYDNIVLSDAKIENKGFYGGFTHKF